MDKDENADKEIDRILDAEQTEGAEKQEFCD